MDFLNLFDLSTFAPSLGFFDFQTFELDSAQRQETTPKTLAISTGDMGGFKSTEKRGESR